MPRALLFRPSFSDYFADCAPVTIRPREVHGPDTLPGTNTSTASVAVGGQVSGTIDDSTDTDWYQVNLVSGTRYVFTLKGAPSANGTLSDPELSLYNSAGTLITSDSNFFSADDSILYTATTTGTHYLGAAAGSSSTGGTFLLSAALDPDTVAGNNSSSATITVNGAAIVGAIDYSTDQDWYAITLTAGTRYVFEMKGSPSGNGTLSNPKVGLYNASGTLQVSDNDSGVGNDALVAYTPTATGTYYVCAEGSAATGTFVLTAALSPDTVPGNNTSTASVAVGGQVSGTIDDPNDTDWYGVTLTAGSTYVITVKGAASGLGTLGNPRLQVLDSTGRQIDLLDDTPAFNNTDGFLEGSIPSFC